MWSTEIENVPHGQRYRLLLDGNYLSFRSLLAALENDELFRRWYCSLLAGCSFAACFWEHPPLTAASADRCAEFVMLDAPSLAGVRANPRPFREHFGSQTSAGPTRFESLGGDATLIAPGPGIGMEAGAHLLTFVRQAPPDSVSELWRVVASTLRALLADKPLWLSTSGLGVYWLHIRIDTTPKYYQYGEYRNPEWLQE